ncbi:MAG: TPM domain-containing protein [Pseudomonadota bacterium]|nr:TPM domain-containing protein [Pseudomonadota bacterium]
MALFTESELKQVADAINNVEQHTDAELVAVLARQSDDYVYIPTLWAAIIALLLPLLLKFTPFWLNGEELLMLQWFNFIALALLFRVPPIMMSLVPKSVKRWRAANLARRQFLDNNLHHTKGETGVLIFIAEAEHYVEIIADRGISQHVANDQWQGIVDDLVASIKRKDTLTGMLKCIEACGEKLKQHAPATESKNELPNHLVVLG